MPGVIGSADAALRSPALRRLGKVEPPRIRSQSLPRSRASRPCEHALRVWRGRRYAELSGRQVAKEGHARHPTARGARCSSRAAPASSRKPWCQPVKRGVVVSTGRRRPSRTRRRRNQAAPAGCGAAPANLSTWGTCPRRMPSMSLTATLTFAVTSCAARRRRRDAPSQVGGSQAWIGLFLVRPRVAAGQYGIGQRFGSARARREPIARRRAASCRPASRASVEKASAPRSRATLRRRSGGRSVFDVALRQVAAHGIDDRREARRLGSQLAGARCRSIAQVLRDPPRRGNSPRGQQQHDELAHAVSHAPAARATARAGAGCSARAPGRRLDWARPGRPHYRRCR